MRCAVCRKPIRWVPKPDGVRVPVPLEPVPDGAYWLDEKGVLREVRDGAPDDVPRYALHILCPEERA